MHCAANYVPAISEEFIANMPTYEWLKEKTAWPKPCRLSLWKQSLLYTEFLLAEVAIQKALERLAVAGFVPGHLVDGLLFAGLAGRS